MNFRLQPELMSSLPIAGIDGTLKARMKGSIAEGWVRAKTGYLNDVVSLAGYAGTVKGDIFSFVFIYNGSVEEAKVRKAFDEMATTLVGAAASETETVEAK
jgi:D-alanyl-D-alanine carboxypeptidase/D-alanyl-D-alanine-endopeptidase (penicillin-binding protein 4)